MGSRRPTLPHTELAAALRADNFRDNAFVNLPTHHEPVYQTLFELIVLCRKQTHLKNFEMESRPPHALSELEQLLLKIYAGTATPEEAGRILFGLQSSPNFYRMLLVKLEALTPHVAWEKAQTLEDMPRKSNAEVLTLVRRATIQNEIRESVGERAWRRIVTITEKSIHTSEQVFNFITRSRALAVGLPLLLIATFTVFQLGLFDQNDPLIHYSLRGDLRGAGVFREQASDYYAFKDAVLQAMSHYVIRDYANTLKQLESIAPEAQILYSKRANEHYATLLRDYYFYTGISHLALSQKRSLFRTQPKRHVESAVAWLIRADSLAQADNTSERYRETFFLGLAYGYNDQKEQALFELKKIPSANLFHEGSSAKIKQWSNP